MLTQRASRWLWVLFFGVCVAGAGVWRSQQRYPIYDSYPLYFGARAWLDTGSAYNLDVAVDPKALYQVTNAETGAVSYPFATQMHPYGNAYPLLAVLLMVPLATLPVRLASLLWLLLLVALLLGALRWAAASWWLIGFYPLLMALRLEQFSALIVAAQIVGLVAYQRRQQLAAAPWIIGVACALMLTKPTQGLLLAVALLVLLRDWRALLLTLVLVLGLPTLLDWNWIGEWLVASRHYREVSQQLIPWWLLLFALPFALRRDWLPTLLIAQIALFPYPWIYTAAPLILCMLHDRRSWVVVLSSWAWMLVAVLFLGPLPRAAAEVIGICITIVLPLYWLRLYQPRSTASAAL